MTDPLSTAGSATYTPSRITVEFGPNWSTPKLVIQLPGGRCYFVPLQPLTNKA